MAVALEEARAALGTATCRSAPSCVAGGEIVARRHNERELSGDPTAHAEMLALRDAARASAAGASSAATLS